MIGGAVGERSIYLVRHAVAKGRSNWKGPDELRPLTKKGERQARGLVDLLTTADVRRIVSSPAVRCIDTVAPSAEKLGVSIELAAQLLEDQPVEDAHALLLEQARLPHDSVVCTHGDVIIELLDLMKRDGVRFHGRRRWSKGSTWVIAAKDGRPHRARYVPPLER